MCLSSRPRKAANPHKVLLWLTSGPGAMNNYTYHPSTNRSLDYDSDHHSNSLRHHDYWFPLYVTHIMKATGEPALWLFAYLWLWEWATSSTNKSLLSLLQTSLRVLLAFDSGRQMDPVSPVTLGSHKTHITCFLSLKDCCHSLSEVQYLISKQKYVIKIVFNY